MVIAGGNRSHAFIANETKPFHFDSYCSDMVEACYFFSFHKNEIFVMGKPDFSAPHGLPRLAAFTSTLSQTSITEVTITVTSVLLEMHDRNICTTPTILGASGY